MSQLTFGGFRINFRSDKQLKDLEKNRRTNGIILTDKGEDFDIEWTDKRMRDIQTDKVTPFQYRSILQTDGHMKSVWS